MSTRLSTWMSRTVLCALGIAMFCLMPAITASAQPARQRALALTSLCIGGMVIARAIADRALADELREATMAVALQLGQWV